MPVRLTQKDGGSNGQPLRRPARKLYLELGANGGETIERDHRRWIQRDCRQSREAGTAVAQPEASRAVRERENRAADEHVPEVLVFARTCLLLLALGIRAQEIPTANIAALYMLEHLSCLEAESLSNHQCRTAT